MLLFSTTEMAIWWVAMTPLSIPVNRATRLMMAGYFRELADEPVPPGETPPLPWRGNPISGWFQQSSSPVRERIRKRFIRAWGRFIVGGIALSVVAVAVGSVVTFPRPVLYAIQAGYFGVGAVSALILLRSKDGRLRNEGRNAAILGVVFVIATFALPPWG